MRTLAAHPCNSPARVWCYFSQRSPPIFARYASSCTRDDPLATCNCSALPSAAAAGAGRGTAASAAGLALSAPRRSSKLELSSRPARVTRKNGLQHAHCRPRPGWSPPDPPGSPRRGGAQAMHSGRANSHLLTRSYLCLQVTWKAVSGGGNCVDACNGLNPRSSMLAGLITPYRVINAGTSGAALCRIGQSGPPRASLGGLHTRHWHFRRAKTGFRRCGLWLQP